MIFEQGGLYRPVEVAALIGISVASVYRLCNSGQLAHFLVEREAGAIRIPGLAVEQLLAKQLDDAVAERAAS